MYFLNSREKNDLEKFVSLCLRKYELLSNEDLEILKIIYNKLGRKAILNLAVKEKIVSFVAYTMSKTNIEKSFWQKEYNYFRDRNIKIVKLLDVIFEEMKNKNIPIFLYENFGSLLLSGEDIGLFCSGDVDLCSFKEYKSDIIKVLSNFGYVPVTRRNKKENFNIRIEFSNKSVSTDNIWINVSWIPLVERLSSTSPNIDVKYFINNKVIINNLNIKVPEKSDLLFLCLLHSSLHKYTCSPGVKLNVDIDRIINLGNIDWNKIIKLATIYRVKRRIAISLMLTHDFLKTPIPMEIMTRLDGNNINIKKIYEYLVGKSFLINEDLEFNIIRSLYINSVLHDRGPLIGFFRVLFPKSKWLKKIYNSENENNIIKAYYLRLKNIFFR